MCRLGGFTAVLGAWLLGKLGCLCEFTAVLDGRCSARLGRLGVFTTVLDVLWSTWAFFVSSLLCLVHSGQHGWAVLVG